MIVGVVKDVKHSTVRDPAMPTSYTLFSQAEKPGGLTYYVRTWQPPQAAANSIRAAIANIDSKLIVGNLTTMNDADRRRAFWPSGPSPCWPRTFGVLATVLAGIGLYGILAYSTAQRTREIGIRMALGARRGTVVSLILREVLILAGWAIGITIPDSRAGHAGRAQPALRRFDRRSGRLQSWEFFSSFSLPRWPGSFRRGARPRSIRRARSAPNNSSQA